MKTKIFFVCLVFCFTHWQAKAQNTIVNDNAAWAVLKISVCPEECPVQTEYIYFDGDSIVGRYSYKKVFSCDDKLHENTKYKGLIREQDKKTYFFPPYMEKEYLLYDFSLEEGMSYGKLVSLDIEIKEMFYVKQVDFVEINGVQKKRIGLSRLPQDYGPNPPIVATWIENIGDLKGGLLNSCMVGVFGTSINLLCYYENNELIYKNPEYSECYYDKREDFNTVQTIVINDCNIFPNPVDDILNISCLNNAISRIEIFNNLGRKIYSQTDESTINVSSFSKGLYFLKVYYTNEQVSVFKIVKNRIL